MLIHTCYFLPMMVANTEMIKEAAHTVKGLPRLNIADQWETS